MAMKDPNPDWKEPQHGECVGSGQEGGKPFLDLYDAHQKVIVRYVEAYTIEPPPLFMVPNKE